MSIEIIATPRPGIKGRRDRFIQAQVFKRVKGCEIDDIRVIRLINAKTQKDISHKFIVETVRK